MSTDTSRDPATVVDPATLPRFEDAPPPTMEDDVLTYRHVSFRGRDLGPLGLPDNCRFVECDFEASTLDVDRIEGWDLVDPRLVNAHWMIGSATDLRIMGTRPIEVVVLDNQEVVRARFAGPWARADGFVLEGRDGQSAEIVGFVFERMDAGSGMGDA